MTNGNDGSDRGHADPNPQPRIRRCSTGWTSPPRFKVELAKLLKAEGFIRAYRLLDDKKQGTLRVYLKFGSGNERVIQGLRRVSRPGLRVYRKAPLVPKTVGGLGVAVVSTPQGLMTGRAARERGLGGEVVCYVL